MSKSLRIFDADAAYGRGGVAIPREIETVEALLAEMDHSGIDEALVWHRDAAERDFALGNQRLTEIANTPRLHPAWTFTPTSCQEMPGPDAFLETMRNAGVRAARAFPALHCFLLDAVSCGDLLERFCDRQIPLFVPLSELSGQWRDVYELMRQFPRLILVLTQTGCWGQDRYFRPLMKTYPGFHITMDRFETAGQFKSLVDVIGPDQLLFASGLPRNYPGGYILSLLHAPIAPSAKEAIAHANLERLLREANP